MKAGLSRFEEAVLDILLGLSENDEFCDLEVQCSDGSVSVQGLVLAAICPNFISCGEFESRCLVLPDILCDEFLLFLRTLLNPHPADLIQDNLESLRKVTNLLGICALASAQNSSEAKSSVPATSLNQEDFIGEMTVDNDESQVSAMDEEEEGGNNELSGPRILLDNLMLAESGGVRCPDLESLCVLLDDDDDDDEKADPPAAAAANKQQLSLDKVQIDLVDDDVLAQNFCDQDGRLVCLVCYKILGPNEFKAYREHVKCHDAKQLEKISILLESNNDSLLSTVTKTNRKKILSDGEIHDKYLDKEDNKLKCDICAKQFDAADTMTFRKHLHYHWSREKKVVYVCPQCSKEFNDPSNLKRHVQNIHEKQIFRCLHCDFEDRRKHKLEDHLIAVHKDKVWVYDEVSLNKGQEVLSELAEPVPLLNAGQPVQAADNRYVYKCSVCSFKKRRLEDTETHIKCNHDATANIKKIALKPRELERKKHPCKHCGEVFSKLNTLNQHKFRVHDISVGHAAGFVCSVCNVQCANKPGLRAHQRTHLEKKFSCSLCRKSFLGLNLLKDHVAKGVCRVENRTCQVCGKVFSDRTRRDIHMKIHTQEKPFKCDVCDKSFTQKRSLKEHSLIHDTERRFQCEICNKKFVQKNHLKYHLTSQHSSSFPEESKHSCELCAKSFPFLHQLKRHQRIHGTTRGSKSCLQCAVCSNWFSSPTILRLHMEHCQAGTEETRSSVDMLVSSVDDERFNDALEITYSQ